MMAGLTSIVILTYNQFEYTRWCLAAIRYYTSEPYELIVVDNGSTDGTVEYLQSQADMEIILNGENKGFAKGCNQGIKTAGGEYILLLNNDTVPVSGWLRNMINCLESDPSIGIVGPRSNYVKGPQSLEVSYTDMDEMFAFSEQFNRSPDPAKWLELGMVVGFCMLVKRAVIDTVGLLDERFGIGFFEDDDYCLRARSKGFKIMCAGDTFVHHFGSWEKYLAKWKH